MYQAIEHLSRALQELMLLVGEHDVMRRVVVQDHVQRIVIVGHLGAEATEVEVIFYVVLVDLAEELVAAQTNEPLDPAGLLLLLIVRARRLL